MSEPNEIREQFVIMLLGVTNRPVPTLLHTQKEIFMLSKMQPKIQELFHFSKHYEGPYSQLLQASVKEPIYYNNAYEFDLREGLSLLSQGKNIYENINNTHVDDINYSKIIGSIKLIRQLFDRLTKDELLLLIYTSYPDYIEYS